MPRPDHQQLAQAQPAPAPPATPAPSAQTPSAPAAPAAQPADTQQAEEPIGSVATVTGKASVTRNDKKIPLAIKDDIYLNDVVQTAASSALGITFSDGTTFNLKANAQITIDNFVYEDGGKNNAGVFDVAKGTVAFVAAQVAKTGDMQITTPTATLGIRGTSGLVEVPAGATAASANNVNIKLYPDADGRVGRIEVNDRAGARLGFLTQGASGFAIRPGAGGVALCRRAADVLAADDSARPGLCAPGPLHANARPPRVRRAAHLPPRQSRLRQSEPTAAPARTARRARSIAPERPARPGRTKPARPAAATGLAEPAGPATAGRARPPGPAAASAGLAAAIRQAAATGSARTAQPATGPATARSATARHCRRGRANPAGTPGQVGAPTGAPAPGGPAGPAPVNQPPRLQQPAGPVAPGGAQPLPQQGGQLQRPGAPGLQRPGLARPAWPAIAAAACACRGAKGQEAAGPALTPASVSCRAACGNVSSRG